MVSWYIVSTSHRRLIPNSHNLAWVRVINHVVNAVVLIFVLSASNSDLSIQLQGPYTAEGARDVFQSRSVGRFLPSVAQHIFSLLDPGESELVDSRRSVY